MASEGYIKLYRQLRKHWLWEEDRRFNKLEAWIDIILSANYRCNRVLHGKSFVLVKRGQFITSGPKLAKRWKWAEKTVRDFLELLEAEDMITLHKTTRYTLIDITNYHEYQGVDNTGVGQVTPRTKDEQKTNKRRTKDDKQERKESKELNIVAAIEADGVPSTGVPSSAGEVPSSPPSENIYTELEHHYCRAVGRVVPSAKDLQSMCQALDIYPLDFIKKVVDEVTRKAGNDKINSFNYFVPILEDEWKKEKVRQERGVSNGQHKVNNQRNDDQYAGIGISP